MTSPPERIRHRIKEIELQPNVNQSKYPISLTVFVDDKQVCELPPIKRNQALKWSRPIICRDVTLQSQLSLEITEVHTLVDKRYKSETYEISDVEGQTETTLAFPGTQWSARIIMLVPETVGQSYPDARQRLTQAGPAPGTLDKLGRAQDVLQAILDFANAVAEACPAAKIVFSACTAVWDKLKEEQKLGGNIQDLIGSLCDNGDIIGLAKVAARLPKPKLEQLKNTVDDILMLFEDLLVYILEQGSRGGLRAILRLIDSEDREIAYQLTCKLNTLRMNFYSSIRFETQGAAYSIDSEIVLGRLNPVDQSSFNLDNQECQDGTREDLISNILAWVYSSPSTSSDSGTVLWMYGQAGIGKSAIAASLYKRLFQEGQLAAGFFCKFDDPRLQQPLEVINTIAYGLALCNQTYGDALVAAIEDNRNLCTTPSMQLRFEGLIKKPLTLLSDASQPHPLVVLVDALDESGTTDTRRDLIERLWDLSQIAPWLKVIVTSRPDADIRGQIEKLDHILTSHRDVHDFKASNDIHAYFEKELGALAHRDGWPEGSIEQLRDKAEGLFIWASTAKRLITDTLGSTKSSWRIVLECQAPEHLDPLDSLYTQVIQNGMEGICVDNRETFRRCIGAIVAVTTRQSLSLPDLCSLLREEVGVTEMQTVVNRLGSVLHTNEKMGGVIRFYHQSFVDFVKDRSRSGELHVDLEYQNAWVARGCLKTMHTELKFNICELETSFCFNNQVQDMEERVNKNIKNSLRYSCTYWISHIISVVEKRGLTSKVKGLLEGPQVLYWLEALSLLGRMDVAVTGLRELLEWITVGGQDARLWALDLYRFTLVFYDAICASTPHLYLSALALAPESTRLGRLKKLFPNTLSVTGGGDRDWPNWQTTFNLPTTAYKIEVSWDGRHVAAGGPDGMVWLWESKTGAQLREPLAGHSDSVTSLAFSPGGNLIVTGSWDKTVRLWDVKTRMPVGDPIVGHSDCVESIAFSPNGKLVVSGSRDRTVRVWDVETRVAIGDPLIGHHGWVTAVVFSPDGSLMASGSQDKTVQVWDTRTHMPVGDPFVEHSDYVESVAFSPECDHIVSRSRDKTMRAWDLKTHKPFGGHFVGHSDYVESIALSADGSLIASGSRDGTVQIWDAKTRISIGNQLVGHSRWVTAVAFSPDGHFVASGSDDKTVRVWDVKTCSLVGDPLVGHCDYVESVAFSPDGDLIASGSDDTTVRIWDANTCMPIGSPLVGHSESVTSVAFSPSGRLIASGSRDKTVWVWDVKTHRSIGSQLAGHSDSVTSLAFSPGGNLIVTGSWDKTVRLWDVKTRMPVGGPIVGHSDCVESIAFSPNGKLVVSGSRDRTVRVWDVETRVAIGDPLIGHHGWVTAVAFSPDGNLVVSGSGDQTVRIWDARFQTSVSDQFEQSPYLSSINTYLLRPIPGRDGWVTLDGQTPFLWLPIRYRRPYTPRTIHVFTSNPADYSVVLNLARFAYGTSWTDVGFHA